jgi:hypothetical protein
VHLKKQKINQFRAEVIEHALKHEVLDDVMGFISALPEKIT